MDDRLGAQLAQVLHEVVDEAVVVVDDDDARGMAPVSLRAGRMPASWDRGTRGRRAPTLARHGEAQPEPLGVGLELLHERVGVEPVALGADGADDT